MLAPNPIRLLYMSPAYEEIFGKPRPEPNENTNPWTGLIHPEDEEAATEAFSVRPRAFPWSMNIASSARMVRSTGFTRARIPSTIPMAPSTAWSASPRTSLAGDRRNRSFEPRTIN